MLKKLVLLGLLLSMPLFAENNVTMVHRVNHTKQVLVSGTLNSTGVTTDPMFSFGYEGAAMLIVDSVSTSSLGNITISLEVYDEEVGKWSTYYGGGDLVTISVSGLSWPFYVGLAAFDAFRYGPGDKFRVKLTSASGSAVINAYLRVQ